MTKITATSLAFMVLSAADWTPSSQLFCQGLAPNTNVNQHNTKVGIATQPSRRAALGWFGKTAAAAIVLTDGIAGMVPPSAYAEESIDIDAYLKSGGVSMPMGVSGQGGKMRPTTGVILRYGT